MACAAASCTPARPKLQSGDLLFEAGAGSAMSEAIRSATGSARELSYTHVGIAVVNGGADSVLEATSEGGVRMTTLEEFLEGGGTHRRGPGRHGSATEGYIGACRLT